MTSKALPCYDLGKRGRYFRWQEEGRKEEERAAGQRKRCSSAEVAAAAPPPRSPVAPGFPLVQEMSRGPGQVAEPPAGRVAPRRGPAPPLGLQTWQRCRLGPHATPLPDAVLRGTPPPALHLDPLRGPKSLPASVAAIAIAITITIVGAPLAQRTGLTGSSIRC